MPREPASQLPFENKDNRMRIMPVDRVDASWGAIDSNDFNLFTRCFRQGRQIKVSRFVIQIINFIHGRNPFTRITARTTLLNS